MVGQMPGAGTLASGMSSDDLLRRIDQNTTMMFHWIRAGMIVVIVLLILIALGF